MSPAMESALNAVSAMQKPVARQDAPYAAQVRGSHTYLTHADHGPVALLLSASDKAQSTAQFIADACNAALAFEAEDAA